MCEYEVVIIVKDEVEVHDVAKDPGVGLNLGRVY